ncbi:unnamed protein product [Ectocarpus sp. 12 AP-2014]
MGDNGNHNRCLDAFIVAFGQVYNTGERVWYTSALELQLASLDFCRACRNVPTLLRILLGEGTPGSLLNVLAEEQQEHPASSRQDRGSSRLPFMRANRVKMVLPDGMLAQNLHEMHTWRGVEELHLVDFSPGPEVGMMVVPPNLKRLKLHSFGPLPECLWPASLHRLELVGFDHSIAQVVWSASLQHLSLGNHFNQPVVGVVWPSLSNSFRSEVALISPLLELRGHRLCTSFRSEKSSISPLSEWCGQRPWNSLCSEIASTSLLLELHGHRLCNSFRSEMSSISQLSGWFGRPPC